MVKPATLWAQFKMCPDSKWIGDICRALGGQSVDLDFGQQQMFKAIQQDSEWMDESADAKQEAWKERQRAKRAREKQNQSVTNECHGDNTMSRDVTVTNECHATPRDSHDVTILPSIHPSVLPSIHPTDINHSITIPLVGDPNGNGNGNGMDSLVKDINEFVAAVHSDPDHGGNAFFDARFDPVVMACAIVGDRKSTRRWRKAVNDLGDGVVRQELFIFYRELRAGESVENKGAALNARLQKIGEKA